MLVDADHRVNRLPPTARASSPSAFRCATDGQRSGHYRESDGTTIAFHATPGYETYAGLGWYGVTRPASGLTRSPQPSRHCHGGTGWKRCGETMQ